MSSSSPMTWVMRRRHTRLDRPAIGLRAWNGEEPWILALDVALSAAFHGSVTCLSSSSCVDGWVAPLAIGASMACRDTHSCVDFAFDAVEMRHRSLRWSW